MFLHEGAVFGVRLEVLVPECFQELRYVERLGGGGGGVPPGGGGGSPAVAVAWKNHGEGIPF